MHRAMFLGEKNRLAAGPGIATLQAANDCSDLEDGHAREAEARA